jgi:glucose-6-phosphate 1-epimerase
MSQTTLLTIDNAFATMRLSLFGAQVLGFCPKHDGRERLFLSSKALLDCSKSIRGGVPVCWPWFGSYKGSSPAAGLPAHGYARTRLWKLVNLTELPHGTEVVLELADTSGPGFVGHAQLQLVIIVGDVLSISLLTRNTGSSSFALGAALHSYFAIDDIHSARVTGLSGSYSDKTQNWAMLPTPSPYRFTAETDRIHLDTPERVELVCHHNVTAIESAGHDSVVVWNPWADGSHAFVDLTADDYRHFVCVETALTQGFELAPGQQHHLHQTIR